MAVGRKNGLEQAFQGWADEIENELQFTEPDMVIELRTIPVPMYSMERSKAKELLRSLYAICNGVYAMSTSISGLVETSNNLARVVVGEGQVEIACLVRSSIDSAKLDLANALKSAFELSGHTVAFSGSYPGWNPDPDSKILQVAKRVYKQLFKEEPRVVACHAGLECGIFRKSYPDIDMVSFGPTIHGAHSPDERVQISSVRKFWNLLCEILREIPEKGVPETI